MDLRLLSQGLSDVSDATTRLSNFFNQQSELERNVRLDQARTDAARMLRDSLGEFSEESPTTMRQSWDRRRKEIRANIQNRFQNDSLGQQQIGQILDQDSFNFENSTFLPYYSQRVSDWNYKNISALVDSKISGNDFDGAQRALTGAYERGAISDKQMQEIQKTSLDRQYKSMIKNYALKYGDEDSFLYPTTGAGARMLQAVPPEDPNFTAVSSEIEARAWADLARSRLSEEDLKSLSSEIKSIRTDQVESVKRNVRRNAEVSENELTDLMGKKGFVTVNDVNQYAAIFNAADPLLATDYLEKWTNRALSFENSEDRRDKKRDKDQKEKQKKEDDTFFWNNIITGQIDRRTAEQWINSRQASGRHDLDQTQGYRSMLDKFRPNASLTGLFDQIQAGTKGNNPLYTPELAGQMMHALTDRWNAQYDPKTGLLKDGGMSDKALNDFVNEMINKKSTNVVNAKLSALADAQQDAVKQLSIPAGQSTAGGVMGFLDPNKDLTPEQRAKKVMNENAEMARVVGLIEDRQFNRSTISKDPETQAAMTLFQNNLGNTANLMIKGAIPPKVQKGFPQAIWDNTDQLWYWVPVDPSVPYADFFQDPKGVRTGYYLYMKPGEANGRVVWSVRDPHNDDVLVSWDIVSSVLSKKNWASTTGGGR